MVYLKVCNVSSRGSTVVLQSLLLTQLFFVLYPPSPNANSNRSVFSDTHRLFFLRIFGFFRRLAGCKRYHSNGFFIIFSSSTEMFVRYSFSADRKLKKLPSEIVFKSVRDTTKRLVVKQEFRPLYFSFYSKSKNSTWTDGLEQNDRSEYVRLFTVFPDETHLILPDLPEHRATNLAHTEFRSDFVVLFECTHV